ncbi:hypothetical protein Tco_1433635 [Tanacetum coccineum]
MENDLELKATVSEYERQQLIKESACLTEKMHKTLNLENEGANESRSKVLHEAEVDEATDANNKYRVQLQS